MSVGADEYGRKDLPAMTDGFGEATQSWREVLPAQTKWRKRDGQNRLPEAIAGGEFRDGLRHLQTAARSDLTNFCVYLS